MTIREILTDCKVIESGVDIMFRCFGPDDEDLLCGYGLWNGEDMIDDEGTLYDLDCEVEDWEFDANDPHYEYGLLTLWFDCAWVEG